MVSDLLGLFGFDIYEVFAGRIPPRIAQAYLERLPFEPWSVWRANQLGGLEHMGWTPDTYKQADILDATLLNVASIRHMGAKGRMKVPEPTYRPKVKEIEEKIQEAQSLADFPIHQLIMSMG